VRLTFVATLVFLALIAAGCGAARTFGRAESAARAGDWDAAVEYYRRAVQEAPDRSDYKIALERAMINASHLHLNQAQLAEARGELEEALREYRRASDFDPPNRQLAAKVIEIERRIRDQYEAQPRSNVAQLREQARQAGPAPLIKLNEVLPELRFNNTSIRDILNFIATATGVNITYDRDYQDRAYTVQLTGVTLDQALSQILSANQLFYKVINQNTIMVIPDTAQKRANYEEQVIRTFYVSHADATELSQMINTIIRVPAMAVQPMIAPNKTANTITIRATTAVAAIIEKMIEANDKPRAEIVIDVQILEVNRGRAKTFGVDLSAYQIGTVFSPESDPRSTSGTGTGSSSGSTSGSTTTLNTTPTFNLNTITRGVSTADFYLAVPSAIVHFLETDTETKLIAKPQLRGAEGQKITLNLGDDIPVPSTVFTPLATGGANTNPLTSFNYRPVGINVEMTPRVTIDGDVILDLLVENSTRSTDVNVAGQNLPSFGTRKVTTRLRLRDGESNLLAGLLREDDRTTLRGIPGILRLPVLNKLLGSNETDVRTTDIVMLLTPRIVRTQEITAGDLSPIFIGTQQNLGLNGPPPLIAAPAEPEPPAPLAQAAPAAPAVPNPAGQGAAAAAPGISIIPPGSSPIPGTTAVAAAPAPAAPSAATPQAATPGAPPPAANSNPVAAGAGAQVIVTPPGPEFRVGGGPYTVAVSATNASRLSGLSLTFTFNPGAVRVRAVQEGSFMRAGGVQAAFTQMVDAATGRIDIAIVRTGDATGVAGTGLLAAIVLDAVGGGPANLSITGTATAPGGTPASLQLTPISAVTVR
jgi:type II secretory pathway component GspD/PulD (secretin)